MGFFIQDLFELLKVFILIIGGFALVRELHVYGQLKPTDCSDKSSKTQHLGFVTQLMKEAERIAYSAGYKNIAVISGVGVRNYYRKLGYVFNEKDSEMMVKKLSFLLDLFPF